MKRKVFIVLVLVSVLLITLFSTACVGSWIRVKPLSDYDFSAENVVEIRFSSSPFLYNKCGTIFALQKGYSQEGDELIEDIALAWIELQRNAVFRRAKNYDMVTTGGTCYYECVFADGSSIKLTRDRACNLYFNDGKSLRRTDNDHELELFHYCYSKIMKQEYIVGHSSDSHTEDCDCDELY